MSDLHFISLGTLFMGGTLFLLSIVFRSKESKDRVVKFFDMFFIVSGLTLFLLSIVSLSIISL